MRAAAQKGYTPLSRRQVSVYGEKPLPPTPGSSIGSVDEISGRSSYETARSTAPSIFSVHEIPGEDGRIYAVTARRRGSVRSEKSLPPTPAREGSVISAHEVAGADGRIVAVVARQKPIVFIPTQSSCVCIGLDSPTLGRHESAVVLAGDAEYTLSTTPSMPGPRSDISSFVHDNVLSPPQPPSWARRVRKRACCALGRLSCCRAEAEEMC